jgi:hypothetical protein
VSTTEDDSLRGGRWRGDLRASHLLVVEGDGLMGPYTIVATTKLARRPAWEVVAASRFELPR